MTVESLGGGLWFPNYHIFRVNNKMLMIVLAMLTGFNKIGLLERGRARGRAVVCFCICITMCLYRAPERHFTWVCVSVQLCVCVCARALCCIRAYYTACVSRQRAAQSAKNHQFKRTKCKTNRNINHACVSEPTLGSLHLYFCSVFVCAVCEMFIMHNIAKPTNAFEFTRASAQWQSIIVY